jgi:hypothetical protein
MKKLLRLLFLFFSFSQFELTAGCLSMYSEKLTFEDTMSIISNPDASRECLEEGIVLAGTFVTTQQLTYGKETKSACVTCEESIQQAIASHPNVSRNQLERLSKSNFKEVRKAVAFNSNTSKETLRFLALSNDNAISAQANSVLKERQEESVSKQRKANFEAFIAYIFKNKDKKYLAISDERIFDALPQDAVGVRKLSELEFKKAIKALDKILDEKSKIIPATNNDDVPPPTEGTKLD